MHFDNCLRVAYDARRKKLPLSVAQDYDEKVRKNWAEKSARNDPDLDIENDARRVNKDRHLDVGSPAGWGRWVALTVAVGDALMWFYRGASW